jgi:hypothetical protein
MTDLSALDRATRALLDHFGIQPDEMVPMIGGREAPALQAYRIAVRAALLAIREPSEAMTAAGVDSGGIAENPLGENDVGDRFWAGKVWRAMLDAALVEK